MKEKLSIIGLIALSLLSVLTLGVNIDFSGLEAISQLIYAFMAIGLVFGLALIVLAIINRYTDGAVFAMFGKLF